MMKQIIAGLLALGLTGCASTSDTGTSFGQITGLWHSVTRSAQLPQPKGQGDGTLSLSIPAQNWQMTFTPIAQRDGVVTWQAGTGLSAVSVATRNGVVIATRGLGDDLISSDISGVMAGLAGQADSGQRAYRLLDGDGGQRNLVFICDYDRAEGAWVETCYGAKQDITNTYPSNTGPSRQWLGPLLGYAELRWE